MSNPPSTLTATVPWSIFGRTPPRFLTALARFGRLGRWLAGRGAVDDGFVLAAQFGQDRGLKWLARAAPPELQQAVLGEALMLMAEVDRSILLLRLAGTTYEGIASRVGLEPAAVGTRYAEAAARLAERVAWVDRMVRRGVSPPERLAIGRVHFFRMPAQEVARSLRLNPEAVALWTQIHDRLQASEYGANR